MSRRALDWVWDNREFAPRVRLVLLALAEHADAHGESCVASLGQLERMTCLSRREVIKALAVLEAAHAIERRPVVNGTPLRWHLQMPLGVAKRKTGSPR